MNKKKKGKKRKRREKKKRKEKRSFVWKLRSKIKQETDVIGWRNQ